MSNSFSCVCGYTVTCESEELLSSAMDYHAKSCPGPKKPIWGYVFSDDAFFVTIGLSAIAMAVASWFN